ncbi:cyclic nucleotide-gated ion channel 1-like [Carya illinoinensis]|uniref:cyclic nucleotide-gated ion channel 1-like n=1 Tax=Carya illinoinensis TaxID=32201 RepID=UPI001C7183D0|nr:cyclic nucleotide-gated ion channel 1-like [Carya illinoinensis]XP_042979405.1 cyclic nucleotide-gated ion channel 1-like [Carya illinoinensis]XP_042979406.1 cyclic nucleotide-gated ion channel 1-like [Carya illinoinensis]
MSYRGHRQENGVRDEDVEKDVSHNDGVLHATEEKKTTKMKILDPHGQNLRIWRMIFVVSCVIAVSVDPLFFYIPVIKERESCLALDKRLHIIAICLRAVTDLIYMVNIILQFICPYIDNGARKVGRIKVVTDAWPIAKRYMSSWYFRIDILAILPLPQVLVPIIFSEMKGSRYLDKRKVLSAIVLLQYVPRVIRIYISWRKLIRTANIIARIVWVKAAFNFFLYILASHVLGAFWYLFSIQRETACWYIDCKKQNGQCTPSSFSCSSRISKSSNHTFVNDFCSPLEKSNATQFDFGIFLEAIQSGTVASTNYPKKVLHCFWWGLRNLSSLGQNLQASTNFWENCFTIFISIFGLLLFLYFIGNVQTYMQLTTERSEEVIQKMKIKERDIDLWITRNGLDDNLRRQIMPNIQRILEQNMDVDAKNPLPHLPIELRKDIKRYLCLPLLKKVPMLQTKSEKLLQLICDSLRPVYYNERTYIIREGEPLDAMIFITQGIVWNFTNSVRATDGTVSLSAGCIESGHFFGEELLDWGFGGCSIPSLSNPPVSTKTFKTHTNVEAFALMAKDLRTLSKRPTEAASETEAASALQAAWRRFQEKKTTIETDTTLAKKQITSRRAPHASGLLKRLSPDVDGAREFNTI